MSIDKMPTEEEYREICEAGFVGSFEEFRDFKENYENKDSLSMNEDDFQGLMYDLI